MDSPAPHIPQVFCDKNMQWWHTLSGDPTVPCNYDPDRFRVLKLPAFFLYHTCIGPLLEIISWIGGRIRAGHQSVPFHRQFDWSGVFLPLADQTNLTDWGILAPALSTHLSPAPLGSVPAASLRVFGSGCDRRSLYEMTHSTSFLGSLRNVFYEIRSMKCALRNDTLHRYWVLYEIHSTKCTSTKCTLRNNTLRRFWVLYEIHSTKWTLRKPCIISTYFLVIIST